MDRRYGRTPNSIQMKRRIAVKKRLLQRSLRVGSKRMSRGGTIEPESMLFRCCSLHLHSRLQGRALQMQ